MYVVRYKDVFFHPKYLYQALHPTADGRWASCGDPYEGQIIPAGLLRSVKAVPIAFEPPLTFSIRNRDSHADSRPFDQYLLPDATGPETKRRFALEYFQHCGDTAVCVRGAYPEQLFQATHEAHAKAHGDDWLKAYGSDL